MNYAACFWNIGSCHVIIVYFIDAFFFPVLFDGILLNTPVTVCIKQA